MPEEGGGRSRQVRGELPEGAECDEPEPEGEVRGGPQERNQEAATVEGSDQDMDRLWGDQGQVHPHGKAETHRDGKTETYLRILQILSSSTALLGQVFAPAL